MRSRDLIVVIVAPNQETTQRVISLLASHQLAFSLQYHVIRVQNLPHPVRDKLKELGCDLNDDDNDELF